MIFIILFSFINQFYNYFLNRYISRPNEYLIDDLCEKNRENIFQPLYEIIRAYNVIYIESATIINLFLKFIVIIT